MRGTFDESGPDAPGVRAAARSRLGSPEFEVAYQRERDLSTEEAMAPVG